MHLQASSLFEIIGFVAGATCVLLGMYESAWNWPVGIINNIAFFILFVRHGVYAASGLQVLYAGIAVYGWWNWVRGRPGGKKLPITRANSLHRALLAALTVVGAVALHWVLRRFTDSTVAWPDATTTALCLAAQYLLSRKLLECWYLWIIADVIYIAMYCTKALYLTAGLYLFFLAMCIAGLARWRREAQAAKPLEAAISAD